MAKDPILPFMEEVTEIGDELKEVFAEVEDLKPLGPFPMGVFAEVEDLKPLGPFPMGGLDHQAWTSRSPPMDRPARRGLQSWRARTPAWTPSTQFSLQLPLRPLEVQAPHGKRPLETSGRITDVLDDFYLIDCIPYDTCRPLWIDILKGFRRLSPRTENLFTSLELGCLRSLTSLILNNLSSLSPEDLFSLYLEYLTYLVTFVVSEASLHIWKGRVAEAIAVSAVVLLYFVYRYLIGNIDRGGSKAGSSGSLDFRDIYISIVLFRAAYVWIKFRDVIPRGAVYHRPRSNKWEPRIKFPVTKGAGGKSKRIPLGLYDSYAKAEVAYKIAAFYCNKSMHRLGRLSLGAGAYFPIPALSVDPTLPYEEQLNQVRNQVLKVYGEFEEQKASRNLLPCVPGQLSTTSLIQQRQERLNSGMDSTMQGQGSQLGPNIHNGVDFNNHNSVLHELLEAYEEIKCLKAQVSRKEDEYNVLQQKNSELEGLLEHQNMLLQLPPLPLEFDFDPGMDFSMGHEESLAR